MNTVKHPEILAPAGGRESLEAAVRCGADAVYLGGKAFSARQNAGNFDDDALIDAARYCRVRGVKLYLTLNTVMFDDELSGFLRQLEAACRAGVDAVLVQDLAAMKLIRESAPGLPLHASTQMSVHDAAGARLLEELGFTRVVLARELSREEIARIREAVDIELECFVHGALCMSVSGQCYLSSMIGGRSGNRGLCAQPCRLPFSAADGREHVLSLKDLSLIGYAAEMAGDGIAALKIEGRMKRPEYVAAAVTACRRALAGEPPDFAALEAVFSRSGFTSGYYDGKRGREMFGVRRKEDVTSAAPVLRQLAALYKDERQSVPVSMELALEAGASAALRVRDGDGHVAAAQGPVPEVARSAPTTPERAKAALEKTGGTCYRADAVEAKIGEGLILSAAALNALRRDALDRLTELRAENCGPEFVPGALPETAPYRAAGAPKLRARIARAAQLTDDLAAEADEIAIPAEEFPRVDRAVIAAHRDKLLMEIPGIVFDRHEALTKILEQARATGIGKATVGGIGGIHLAREHGFAVHGDYGLNITNTRSLEEYRRLGLSDATLSLELELGRVRALGGSLSRGLAAWGHLPLMAARNCPAGDCKSCDRSFPTITDRLGNQFFVDCVWGVSRLYNCVPLFLADRLSELSGVDFLTLYYTRESPEECLRILRLYRAGGELDGKRTRGLCYRKVQ